jgi:predicted Rossmann fold flavoprotein
MIAAWRAATLSAPTLLLEKKNRLGTKILISGGGKCNLTHAGAMETIRQKFRLNEGRFLRPSFYKFSNDDYLELLTERGIGVYTRPDGRIFPVPPADAQTVVEIMESILRDAGVRIQLDSSVHRICAENGTVQGLELEDGQQIETSRLIIATGGSSYPATGCTGDGWRWLAALGHTIVPLRAALAPLYLNPVPPADWSGVALRDCLLKARRLNPDGSIGKERTRWRGDMLFTHKGISGPTALGVSREIADALPEESTVEVDILPNEPHDALSARLAAHCRDYPRRSVADFVETVVPHRLTAAILEDAKVAPTVKGAHLGQKERNRLVDTLKGWSLGRVRHVPLERGEVVAGGVALEEVDPQTMRSKIVRGLYLCGEVLDIAGPVGGYNLQAAWSTGFVAGERAAQDLFHSINHA